jgi:hypothetical protein
MQLYRVVIVEPRPYGSGVSISALSVRAGMSAPPEKWNGLQC